jgi:hypothetical protein
MRTMVVLVTVLLTLGLCSVPAMAGDNAVIQQLPASCQPVSDVELSQIQGKGLINFNGCAQAFLCQAVRCVWANQVPDSFKRSCIGQQLVRCYQNFCRTNNNTGG